MSELKGSRSASFHLLSVVEKLALLPGETNSREVKLHNTLTSKDLVDEFFCGRSALNKCHGA